MAEQTCKERVAENYKARISDLRTLWELWKNAPDANHPDLGNWNEYGLAFDYVAPGTFNGQRRGYFRYQLSWGGPSDEFRYFADEGFNPVRIEYWFMDWFDGAKRTLKGGADFDLMAEIFGDLKDCGVVESEYKKAMADVEPAY